MTELIEVVPEHMIQQDGFIGSLARYKSFPSTTSPTYGSYLMTGYPKELGTGKYIIGHPVCIQQL